MGNRYRAWADEQDGPFEFSSLARPTQPVPSPQPRLIMPSEVPQQAVVHADPRRVDPSPQPQGHIAYAPPPNPVYIQIPMGAGPRRPVHVIEPVQSTCAIVKQGDRDPYAEMLRGVPDIAKEAGIDYSNGVDAMALPGLPEGAAGHHWTPNARYYNGSSDASARERLDDHVARRHQASLGAVRSIAGMTVGS